MLIYFKNFNIEKFNSLIIVLFTISISFSSALSNIFFAILCISTIIDYLINRNVFETKNINYPFYFLFFLLIFTSLNALFQGTYSANKGLWKFLPILCIGSFLFLSKRKLDIDLIKKVSITTSVFFVFLCLIRTFIFYSNNHYIPFANGNEMIEILKIHRPYLGFYILLNIIFSFNLYNTAKHKLYKFLYGLVICVLFAFISLISARLSILSFIIITITYILFYLKISFIKKVSFSLISLISLFCLVYTNPNIRERLNHNNIELLIDYEPRVVIWESVYNIKHNDDFKSFLGYGNYQLIEDYLVINYEILIDKKDKKDYYVSERFNTHSQFFDYFLFGGYPALLLFLFFCLTSLWITRKNFYSFAIVLAFILFFLVENVFHRQLGCYLFILYFIISLRKDQVK